MPLPKPPAKRAALLDRRRFRIPGRPQTRQTPAEDPRHRRAGVARRCSTCSTALARGRSRSSPKAPAPVAAEPARAAAAGPPGARRPSARKPRGNGPAKLFVLDTNVLMHDPMCLFRFEEHDIYLPMITLEELDGHKRA